MSDSNCSCHSWTDQLGKEADSINASTFDIVFHPPKPWEKTFSQYGNMHYKNITNHNAEQKRSLQKDTENMGPRM